RLQSLGRRQRLPAIPGPRQHAVAKALQLRLQAKGDEILGLNEEDVEPFCTATGGEHRSAVQRVLGPLTIRRLPTIGPGKPPTSRCGRPGKQAGRVREGRASVSPALGLKLT